ncbi:MAG: NADH-quinone oxidoreductase subunit N [Bdellovibrionales bacterium]|nr:NADH-quinone oxidoreductase subunit N [Bdellovibrionales bacterium]
MEQPLVTIRPELLSLSWIQLQALGPWIWTIGGALAMMLAAVLFKKSKWVVPWMLILCSLGAAWSCVRLMNGEPQFLFNKMMVVDQFSLVFLILFCVAALVTTMVSTRYLERDGFHYPEYFILMLFSVIGMMSMVAALDLIVIFLALELMSISVYVLVGFRRADRKSNEAAVKYFVLGGAASAVFLYGSALIYGATGSVHLSEIVGAVKSGHASSSMIFVMGSALVIFGFLFKVASVPFHMWMPDVYEGAPVPVTGFMTTGIKAASFAAFVRVLSGLGYGNGLADAVNRHIHDILWVSAALTMIVGNVIALTQVNLKRMLAYSSIAHTGYILVGILAGPGSEAGYGPIYLYLLSYTVMNLGAFAVLTALAKKGDSGVNLHDLAGLSKTNPYLALALSVFLFSMAGIPPTAGFAAKYLLLSSAVGAGEILITVIAVLCSAISVYYYLRVLVYMYMREPAVGTGSAGRSWFASAVILAMIVLTLQIGILPSRVIETARTVSKMTVAVAGPEGHR